MTEDKIYFQWQNPFLRPKIYPCRNVELMDFLVTYKEADLVQESKSKSPGLAQNWVKQELNTYRQNLQSMVDRNDHSGLLEKVFAYLEQSNHNFDPWIKYMVIHFSGMRYKTAHGSYADPRQLLVLLESKEFSDLRRWLLGIQPDLLDAEINKALPELSQILVSEKDPQILQKLQKLQLMMKDQRLKRQGIIDFRQLQSDQRKKQYLSLLEDDALSEIEKRGPTGSNLFPDWLWAEIVRRTGLKLKYVGNTNKDDWDSLSYELQRSRINSSPEWRQFFVDWLRSPGCDITAWREKNYRDLELVVSSAVCNEVSEHIHHLRGLKPSGGLTARPLFYLQAEFKDNPENQPQSQSIKSHQIQHDKESGKTKSIAQPNQEVSLPSPGPNKAFLRRATAMEYFLRGGSILWLRWVNPKPNPWQITHPIRDHQFLQGDGRDWRYIFQPAGTESIYLRSKTIPVTVAQPVATRKPGDKEKAKNKTPGQKQPPTSAELTQWLRWMHESIIVDILEMLDGWTVITFETHPMTRLDDPNQSVTGKNGQPIGATGINRYRLADLVSTRVPSRWDVFVGYSPPQPLNLPAIPGKPVPKDRIACLQQMLDPTKILAKEPPVSYFISTPIITPIQGIDWFTEEDDIQRRWDDLTPRQKQMVALLAQGQNISQIAHQLDTNSTNVQAHLRNARKRMGATSNLELVSMIEGIKSDDETDELDSSF